MPKSLCASLCLLFLGSALLAQPQPAAYVVESTSHLEWQIQDEYEGVSVVVVGPEGFAPLTRQFQAGEGVFVELQGDSASLPDGQYTWEIRIQPVQENQLQAHHQDVATRGLGTEPRQGVVKGSTEAGTFRVQNGVIAPRLVEEPQTAPSPTTTTADNSGLQTKTSADQVFLDDLIVDGSACVGVDCVNGENFGFDTIRLKENNLRVHFDDTSTSASFPGNDWRLVVNDSANGGANKFSIEDASAARTPFTIEAGAPNDALRVDNGGNLGLGTAAPVVEAHMVDGDTPTLRLQQDGSSGFTPQTWDVAGNDANFFVRDATNGSQLPFRIFPSAPTNALTLAANGNVGLGLQTATQAFHLWDNTGSSQILVEQIGANSAVEVMMTLACNCAPGFRLKNTTSDQIWFFRHTGGGDFSFDDPNSAGQEMLLTSAGNLTIKGTLSQGSSRALKENLTATDGNKVLSVLKGLDLYEWSYIDQGARHFGPMAEEFSAAYGLGESAERIAPGDMAGLALAAVKALEEQNSDLKSTIETLMQRIDALEAND